MNDTTVESQVPHPDAPGDDAAMAEAFGRDFQRMREEIAKHIVGQDEAVELVLLSIVVGGNSLLVGVPGLAKTRLIHTVSRVVDLSFSRIQFTPDLMPSDITGTDFVQEDPDTGRRSLIFARGPVFSHIVLADEINRTPPKTQAALLEAMQEHHVSIQGQTHALPEPFFVFATQNPIELEGTYPLPEAQLDRFMFEVILGYPTEARELEIVRSTTAEHEAELQTVVGAERILEYQRLVRRVPIADDVSHYALTLVRATRAGSQQAPGFINDWLSYGASVRAAQYLTLGGKARALSQGRVHVGYEDIRALARPVLRHRIMRNFQAEAEQVTSDHIIDRLMEEFPSPGHRD
jgi:MoxR-like ATPase